MRTAVTPFPDGCDPVPPKVPWLRAPALLVLFAAAILLATWPWAKTFASGMFAHWDPPFHAWKLEFAARQLLEGHLLPPDGNTNMYYPYSGAFYFEALHWPQAVFAAALFGLTGAGPVLVYHLTLVFFWALSGVCLWALLRALGISAAASLFGALCFVLMPYRLSYRVEFNMQLCFAVPLFLFFLVRFFQRPGVGYACGAAVAWWLQATSELYQAVFLLLVIPFTVLAMLKGRWELLRSWRFFWRPALAALLVGGALVYVWLWPYSVMLGSHTLVRRIDEIRHHVLEPLSYLSPGKLLAGRRIRVDEMVVYPSAMLIVLSFVSAALFLHETKLPAPRWRRAVWWARASALALFLAIAAAFHVLGPLPNAVGAVYVWLPVVACACSVPLVAIGRRQSIPDAFLAGLFASALFAFFMSLGPDVLSRAAGFARPNWLFLGLYQWLPALQGFRVVSRFAFLVLLWMTLASAWVVDRALRLKPRRLRLAAAAAAVALLASFVFEIAPRGKTIIRPMPCPLESRVLDNLGHGADSGVLAIVPMGERSQDSQHMLQVARHDRLSVYAWGGAYPAYTKAVCNAFSPLATASPAKVADLLRQLWPECRILEDKDFSRRDALRPSYAEWLADEATVEDEDARFVLLRLKPESREAPERIRLVRHDFLVKNPQVRFTATASTPATLWLDLNGRMVGRWEIGPTPATIRLVLPQALFLRYAPNRLRFHADGDTPFILAEFGMEPAALGTPVAATNLDDLKPWMGMARELPPQVRKLDVAYPRGLVLRGVEILDADAKAGGVLRMRYYVDLPKSRRTLSRLAIKTGFTEAGEVVFESGPCLVEAVDMNAFWIGRHDGMYVLDIAADVPFNDGKGGDYGLAITVRDAFGRRLSGRDPDGGKIRRIHLPGLTVRSALPIRTDSP